MSGSIQLESPIDNDYFLPVGKSIPAHHSFQGTLKMSANALDIYAYVEDYYPVGFPAISVSFFTFEHYLVPVDRGIIKGKYGKWGVIIDPGKVWSEPADSGMSRASFPFTLLIPDPNNPRCHNGVATFLYDDSQVSSLYIQVVQETNPDLIFDMWGSVPIEYSPGIVTEKNEIEAQFKKEVSQQVTIQPWDDLEDQYGAKLTRIFNRDVKSEDVSAAGLIDGDILYLQSPMTRYGPYPFPRYMRSHVYSVSKSIGNAIAMLRLAEKYGDKVFDLKIADYLDVTADHNGWDEVTFGDTLNMAVGVGNGSHERYPFDIYGDDTPGDGKFYHAQTTQEKLKFAFSSANHPWGPGEVARYINPHAFVLSAAMDAYLKSEEGPDAHLWDFLIEEVFHPIGISHLPMLHTIERDGSEGIPMMLLGAYPTVDDTAKISILLQNNGRYGEKQILSTDKLTEALYKGDVFGLPTGKKFKYGDQSYHMSFWGHPYRTQDGLYYQVPYMQGSGGSSVVLMPNGITAFRYTDAKVYDVEPLVRAAEIIRQFADGHADPIW
jgi:hypothetical protein